LGEHVFEEEDSREGGGKGGPREKRAVGVPVPENRKVLLSEHVPNSNQKAKASRKNGDGEERSCLKGDPGTIETGGEILTDRTCIVSARTTNDLSRD